MFPGIEGGPWQMSEPIRAMRDSGVDLAFDVLDWSKPLNHLANLTDLNENKRIAATVAERIDGYRREHPTNPIHLVGYSGGAGLALLVVEALAANTQIDNVILVHAAISPKHDLTPALTHIRGRLVNFYCPSDWLILGAGTSVFGTIDREYSESAGRIGFVLTAAAADETLRRKIEQRKWTTDAIRAGHFGGHLGGAGYSWNRRYVAPWLVTR